MPPRNRKPAPPDGADLARIINASWDDFKAFMLSDEIAQRHPEGENWEFAKRLQTFITEHEEICKSIFGSGFVASQEFLRQVMDQAVEMFAMQHMAEHHRNNPKAPRA